MSENDDKAIDSWLTFEAESKDLPTFYQMHPSFYYLEGYRKCQARVKKLEGIITKFLEHSRECANDYDYIYGDIVEKARAALADGEEKK